MDLFDRDVRDVICNNNVMSMCSVFAKAANAVLKSQRPPTTLNEVAKSFASGGSEASHWLVAFITKNEIQLTHQLSNLVAVTYLHAHLQQL
jgi:hypothetical protein